MKSKHRFTIVALPVVLAAGTAVILSSCSPAREPSPEQSASADPNAVAKIGDFVVTRAELEDRLVRAIRPREEQYPAEAKPVTAESVLKEMLAEKAMSMEGRRLGYLQDELIHTSLQEAECQRLAQKVAESYLNERMPAQKSRVEAVVKANPQLTPTQATNVVRQEVMAQVRKELEAKFHLEKHEENFVKAALIHQRLLLRPVTPRGTNEYWIKNSQVREELSEEEKNLVLASYEGGQFTLKDWFHAVCNIAPPRRPSDLNTPPGVGRLLDNALWIPLLVAEAKARGYDKDPELRRQIRQMEDQRLLYKVMAEKTKDLVQPSPEQVKTYFEENQKRFMRAATMKIDQIWCEDIEMARKVKADLDGGADFEALKQAHSLQKKETPHVVSAVGEGIFWDELWKGEPNQTLGPVRGFYGSGVKWRIVRVLEKTPGAIQPYTEQLANNLKWTWMDDQRQRILDEYRAQLLKKYPYEIFRDRIKDMDPLKIAMNKEDK